MKYINSYHRMLRVLGYIDNLVVENIAIASYPVPIFDSGAAEANDTVIRDQIDILCPYCSGGNG